MNLFESRLSDYFKKKYSSLRYSFLLESCFYLEDHDCALNAEIVCINSFYMDIGLDNYRGARTSKLPNCSNWSRSCSRLGLGQGVPQFSRKESKGWDCKKNTCGFIGQNKVLKKLHKVYSIDRL